MGDTGRVDSTRNKWVAPFALTLAAAWIIWLNPVGFVGGGADDSNNMKAVRCWVAAGEPCLAHTHWATRWPIIAPVAFATGLLGQIPDDHCSGASSPTRAPRWR